MILDFKGGGGSGIAQAGQTNVFMLRERHFRSSSQDSKSGIEEE